MMLLDLPSEPTSFLTPVLLNNFLSLTTGEFLPDPGAFSLALLPTLATSTKQNHITINIITELLIHKCYSRAQLLYIKFFSVNQKCSSYTDFNGNNININVNVILINSNINAINDCINIFNISYSTYSRQVLPEVNMVYW